MKKLEVCMPPLKHRTGWEKHVYCDGVKIGEIVSKFEGEETAHWYHSGSKERFATQTQAVRDLGRMVFGENEQFEVSPDRDR